MKIVIFGATGSLGRHLVNQALDQGHHVTAFSRRPGTVAANHPNLEHVAGDVFDADQVSEAVGGQDAVVCALGAGMKGGVRAAGTRNILAAMKEHGVRRLICLSSLGVGDSRGNLNFFWRYIMFGLLLRRAYADHVEQEAAIMESDVDWVVVRPSAFIDGPARGTYRHGFPSNEAGLKLQNSRADVAGFMLGQLTDDTYLGQTPGLSY